MQWCQYNFCNQTETILNIHSKNLACQDNFDEFYMKLASSTNNNHLSPKIKTVLGVLRPNHVDINWAHINFRILILFWSTVYIYSTRKVEIQNFLILFF